MSRFFGKSKEKDKNQKFYVEFLGWIESRGLAGEKYTTPVVNDLRKKYQKWKNALKLTLQVSKGELKISQDIPEKNKKKIRTVKFPVIPARDVTFITQARNPITGMPDDIVACIYLGYIPRTKRNIHVHVYRFDTPETATKYVKMLRSEITVDEERLREIEMNLIARGEIDDPRMNNSFSYRPRLSPRDPGIGSSDGMSEPRTDSAPDSAASTCSGNSFPSDEIEPDLISLQDQMPFESVTEELKNKLNMSMKEGVPLLLPPKDYDTIRRKQGDLEKSQTRKSLNASIVGNMPWSAPRSRNISDESGIGLESPSPSEEQKKFPDSVYEDTENSPPLTARSANEFVYPPQSARSPRVSNDRHAILRQPSFSSAYSSQSYRSGSSSHSSSFIEKDNSVMYTGRSSNDIDIPPADYDSPDVRIRENQPWKGTDITNRSSMPVTAYPRDVPEYAMINKKRATSTNTPPQFPTAYTPPGTHQRVHGVRRVNSMYK